MERLRDKQARKRTGITTPAQLYDRYASKKAPHLKASFDPSFLQAMQRIWDIGTIDGACRVDRLCRRAYLLIARGSAPLSEADVVKLGRMELDDSLRPALQWLAHRLSLAETQARVDKGEVAPPITES